MQYLYRHFNKKGDLLYIGISNCHLKRLSQHKKTASWFNDISKITIEMFGTKTSALVAEREAIINEKPIYNLMFSKSEMPKSNRLQDVCDKHRNSKALLIKISLFDDIERYISKKVVA